MPGYKKLLAATLSVALVLPVTAQAAKKTITFMELNDLHAHLIPHTDVVSDGNGGTKIEKRGGLTRIATAVKQIRAENPNNVLMNVGDTFHGGAEAFFTVGNAVVDPLNALNIDVGVPGNWDYYYSPPMFRARFGQIDTEQFTDIINVDIPLFGVDAEIKRPNYPSIAANIEDVMDGGFQFMPNMEEFMPATHTMEIDGITVGFIGLTSDIVANMHDMLAQGFNFAQGLEEHKNLINQHTAELRNSGADIVVVMSELGIHKTKELADVVDAGVDVFFAAHTHEATYTPIDSASGALVVEAGNDGYLGRMDITVDKKRRSSNVIARDWTLIDLDDSVAEDPEMVALVETARAPFLEDNVNFVAPPPFFIQTLNVPLNTVIGHTDHLMDRKDALESTFNNGWTDTIRRTTGTQVAFTPGFRMGSTIAGTGYEFEDATYASGEVTMEDAFRFFPMLYAISTGETNGQHIRGIIENVLKTTYSSEAFNHMGGWNYGFSGLDMTLDLAAGDGQRLKDLRYSDTGQPVGLNDSISITGCQRLPMDAADTLCAYPGFENVTSFTDSFLGEESTALDLFVYLMGNDNVEGSRSSITDLSNTPRWPETEFIQPLDGVGPAVTPDEPEDCGFFGSCSEGGGFGGGGISIFGNGIGGGFGQ